MKQIGQGLNLSTKKTRKRELLELMLPLFLEFLVLLCHKISFMRTLPQQ